MTNFDLVCSLQALSETDPVELDGIQFGPTCASTQGSANSCAIALVSNLLGNIGGILQTTLPVGVGIGILGSAGTGGC